VSSKGSWTRSSGCRSTPYGAPALTLKEFAGYTQDLIVGASLQVSVPLGQYDESRVVNIGTNRWWAHAV
jgi:hypothetical protein